MSRLLFRCNRKNDNADNGKSRLNWWQNRPPRAQKTEFSHSPALTSKFFFIFSILLWFFWFLLSDHTRLHSFRCSNPTYQHHPPISYPIVVTITMGSDDNTSLLKSSDVPLSPKSNVAGSKLRFGVLLKEMAGGEASPNHNPELEALKVRYQKMCKQLKVLGKALVHRHAALVSTAKARREVCTRETTKRHTHQNYHHCGDDSFFGAVLSLV